MALGEFDIIRRFFSELGPQHPSVICGVGDDCALLSIPMGYELALSIDTLVEGIHFPQNNDSPYWLAQRALRVAASDLAAAGAAPLAFTLALTLPSSDEVWLSDFAKGLSEAASVCGLRLVGGDTTRGPLSITIQVQGLVSKDRMLRRNRAKVGDRVFVSGSLGAARAALNCLSSSHELPAEAAEQFLSRYWQPEPRLKLGVQLRSVASACLDISDGLLADVQHIAEASQVGVVIDVSSLPVHSQVIKAFDLTTAQQFALTGGDDYELCFTVPPEKVSQIPLIAQAVGCEITCVGEVVAGSGVQCRDSDGACLTLERYGYQHFESESV